MSSKGIADWINRLIGSKDFGELNKPFAATATNFATGKMEVLKEGSVAEAVRNQLLAAGNLSASRDNGLQ